MFQRIFWRRATIALPTTAAVGIVLLNRRQALDDDKQPSIYRSRTTASLCSSLMVYTVCASPTLVALGKAGIRICDVFGASFIYEAIALRTFYRHFCGGQTPAEVQNTVVALNANGKHAILTYAREEASTEEGYEQVFADVTATINAASITAGNFVALKLTALADPESIKRSTSAIRHDTTISDYDKAQLKNLQHKLDSLINYAIDRDVRIMIDAERDCHQLTIERLTLQAQRKYNTSKAHVFGTYQMYLKRMPSLLSHDIELARRENWHLGVKLVRGAYMATEPREIIHPTKQGTDEAFNNAIETVRAVDSVIATHNETSIKVSDEDKVAQLFGMAHVGRYQYVPWGPVKDAMGYLLRRADENATSTDRARTERNEIVSELLRRVRS